jgi:hypothetical protein
LDQALTQIAGNFTVAELERLCPGVSRELIRHWLKELKAAGAVQCVGRGPGAQWRKEGSDLKEGNKRGIEMPIGSFNNHQKVR